MRSAPKQHPEVTQSSAALSSRAHLGHACSGSMAMPARKQTFTHAVAARRHAATHACTLLRVCMRRHGPGSAAAAQHSRCRGVSHVPLSLAQSDPGARTPVWHRKGVWSRRGSEGPPRPTVSRPSVPRRAAAVRTVAGRDHRNDTACCSRASWSAHASPRSPSECAATLGCKRAWGDATLCAPAQMRPWPWRC